MVCFFEEVGSIIKKREGVWGGGRGILTFEFVSLYTVSAGRWILAFYQFGHVLSEERRPYLFARFWTSVKRCRQLQSVVIYTGIEECLPRLRCSRLLWVGGGCRFAQSWRRTSLTIRMMKSVEHEDGGEAKRCGSIGLPISRSIHKGCHYL